MWRSLFFRKPGLNSTAADAATSEPEFEKQVEELVESSDWGKQIDLAEEFEEKSDWENAEASFLDALNTVSIETHQIAATYDYLSRLCSRQQKHDQALAYAKLASKASFDDGIISLIGIMVAREVELHLQIKNDSDAISVATAGLEFIHRTRLNNASDSAEKFNDHGIPESKILVQRAKAFIRMGELKVAELDLTTSLQNIQPMVECQESGGIQVLWSDIQFVSAELMTAKGAPLAALNCATGAVKTLREINRLEWIDRNATESWLADGLQQLASHLQIAGRDLESEKAYAEAKELLGQVQL